MGILYCDNCGYIIDTREEEYKVIKNSFDPIVLCQKCNEITRDLDNERLIKPEFKKIINDGRDSVEDLKEKIKEQNEEID